MSLVVLSPAHTPNFDLVADVVNATSPSYRSPKACKLRYDNVLLQREEGRLGTMMQYTRIIFIDFRFKINSFIPSFIHSFIHSLIHCQYFLYFVLSRNSNGGGIGASGFPFNNADFGNNAALSSLKT